MVALVGWVFFMINKRKILQLFLLTLAVLPGFVWLLLTQKSTQALESTTPIYTDSLAANWESWSWNASLDYNATETPKSGSKVLSVTYTNWGGFYLHTTKNIDTTQADAISFSLKTTQNTNKYLVILYDANNKPLGTPKELTAYGDTPAINTWKDYTISLPQNTIISGFALQDISGTSNKIYFDDILIKLKNTQPITQTTSVPTTIYDETLATGWQNWSWNSIVQFDNKTAAASGTKAIAFTATSPWAGLYLHTDTNIDTTSLQTLQFSFRPSQQNQKFSVILFDDYHRMLSQPIPLDKYGVANAGTYKNYAIPLADLGAKGKKVSGIVLQEANGNAQPVVYIDALSLTTSQNTSATMTPVVTQAQTPTLTSSPATSSGTTPAQRAKKFFTLAPGSSLPTGEQCSSLIQRSSWEPRPENITANNRKGVLLTTKIDGANDTGNAKYKNRIDGNFTGTTDEIIQWGACKWGLDEDIVRSVAAQESWWRQSTKGDFNGSDYESYGLLQVRRTYHQGTYPLSYESVPFNVDYALGWRRACMDGYFDWIPASSKGDEWGCVGLWFSGRWYDGDANVDYSGANWYISKVKGYLNEKPWLKEGF